MLSDKLITLLKSFQKKELNRFRKYLLSPFFNENTSLIDLFDLVDQHIRQYSSREFDTPELQKKDVWIKLFPNKVYNDIQIRRLCSDLGKLALDFLAHQNYTSNPISVYSHLLPALNNIQRGKHFKSTVHKALSLQQKTRIWDANYYYHNFIIEQQRDLHQAFSSSHSLDNIHQADQHLDCFYIIHKLQLHCHLLSYQETRSLTGVSLFQPFMDILVESTYLEIPAVAIYYQMVLCLSEKENETHYQKLKTILEKHHTFFSIAELQNIYLLSQNYCVFQINLGKVRFYDELFNIYKILLEKEIIFTNGELHPQNYKNIITVGLTVENFEWVENFIQVHTQRLPKKNQDNDLNYNLAKVYFHTGQHEKVIDQLREVEYKTLNYALEGKLMLLKTYYELKEYRALESLMDSFRIYLHRNRVISRDVKQQYLNVLRFVKKLAYAAPYDTKNLEKIKKQIHNCKALADKKWILEKLAERE